MNFYPVQSSVSGLNPYSTGSNSNKSQCEAVDAVAESLNPYSTGSNSNCVALSVLTSCSGSS